MFLWCVCEGGGVAHCVHTESCQTLSEEMFLFQDFDIAGQYDGMIPDAECLKIVHEILSELDIGDFRIKVRLFRRGGERLNSNHMWIFCRSTTDASWTGCSVCVGFLMTSSEPSAPQWINWTRCVGVFSFTTSPDAPKLHEPCPQMPWEDVRKEMVNDKGLAEEVADQIGHYVSMQGETAASARHTAPRQQAAACVPATHVQRLCFRWDGPS